MSHANDRVGYLIRRRRQSLGLTLQELGDAVGVSVVSIHKYETGKVTISVEAVVKIASAMKTPVAYFFLGLHPRKTSEEDREDAGRLERVLEALPNLERVDDIAPQNVNVLRLMIDAMGNDDGRRTDKS